MKVYTKQGDSGTTSLVGGDRVSKTDPRVEAYGTVDELMAHVAFLHDLMAAYPDTDTTREQLVSVLNSLMNIAAILATNKPVKGKECLIDAQAVENLEHWIDTMDSKIVPITRFTLGCGHQLLSQSHICRTICRRAERRIVASAQIQELDPNAMQYINRLSDYFYVLGRFVAQQFNVNESYWMR